MVRKIQINLSNKLFYTIITLGILILVAWVVYAYGGSQPSVMGHSAGEIEGGVTSGAVMFFNLASCPSGWTELTSAQGRYIVAKPSGGTLAITVGTALSDQENRAVGKHNHRILTDYAYGGTGGTITKSGSVSDTTWTEDAGSVDGTNAPYIQLLVCQKD